MSCCRIHTHEKTCYPSGRRKKAGVTHSTISNALRTEKKIVKRTYGCNCCGPHCAKTLKWVKNLCNSLEFATMIRKDKAFRIQFYQSGTLLISSLVAASQSACQKKCWFFFFSQAVNEAEDTVIQYFWTRLVFINYDPAPSACLLLLCEVQSLAIGVTESRDFLDPRRKKRHKKGSPRVLRQHGWEQGLNQRRRRRRRGRRRRKERGGVTRFTYRLSPFFFFTSRPPEKLRVPLDRATPGGHWVTGQYGVSLALTAATRQTDCTLWVHGQHGKSTLRQIKALRKAAEFELC